MLHKVNAVINKALDNCCPMSKPTTVDELNPWWTAELKQMRKEISSTYSQYKNDKKNVELQNYYKRKQKEYRRKCRKEQRMYKNRLNESVRNEEQMAKKIKHLTTGLQPKVTTLQTDQGKSTEVGEETCKEMMNKHFPPESQVDEKPYSHTKLSTKDINKGSTTEWITSYHVRRVLLKFKAKKSPGPDCFKPIIFKHLPNNILETIAFINRATLALHYTPKVWKESNVVFIPKAEKDNYQKAKSFRPISLSNYLLKGLEKLVVEQVDIAIEENPIHKNQHGFQRGKSTETAISKTVNYIEKHLSQGREVLGVFLDIQAAFDTICPKHIRDSLLKHGADEDIAYWYYNYITNRKLTTCIGGFTYSINVGIGFPQGGVCSAKFWIIAFNEAIEIINTYGI